MSSRSSTVTRISRREFVAAAAAMGASAAWAGQNASPRLIASERRDLYPEGVASGDPNSNSVLLWTRRPYPGPGEKRLIVEVAADMAFGRVVATAHAMVTAASDWTCRVLVGNLEPAHVYWYRFVDEDRNASRIGRTLTAPDDDDDRPVKFAFVSCQDINTSALNAYRRMIFEDEGAKPDDRLAFVLHLGDFIYELVWYPEDNPNGLWGRRVREVVRYANAERIQDGSLPGIFHVPTTLDDYRAVYRAFLHNPDLQDARARWPFVCMWDNHEFSTWGWQSFQFFYATNKPAQTRKMMANQAWFEYQPARVRKTAGGDVTEFVPPTVADAPIARFDDDGFGDEANNRVAVGSLTTYRSLRWGRNVELFLTDQHNYRSEDPTNRPEAKAFASPDFLGLFPQEVLEILDAGRAYAGGHPPSTIRFGDQELPNFRKDEPPRTILGAEQKEWLVRRLGSSSAPWKIWGNSQGTLDQRVDFQNLPPEPGRRWPGLGYAVKGGAEPDTTYLERAEIYAAVREKQITGFATVCGNRHQFWAGFAAPFLPPKPFEPVGVAFVTGAISSSNTIDLLESDPPREHPLRALYAADRASVALPELTANLLFRHGVRSALEYSRTGDVERARAVSNKDLAPHLTFVDLGGHGYSTVHVTADLLECEFVCIPRPIERNAAPDGGPLRYRVVHRTPLWKAGETPRLEQRVVEGNPALSF